jgi:hypothetical protein
MLLHLLVWWRFVFSYYLLLQILVWKCLCLQLIFRKLIIQIVNLTSIYKLKYFIILLFSFWLLSFIYLIDFNDMLQILYIIKIIGIIYNLQSFLLDIFVAYNRYLAILSFFYSKITVRILAQFFLWKLFLLQIRIENV